MLAPEIQDLPTTISQRNHAFKPAHQQLEESE
jgi:hypothetical protein